jgi:DnaJ-class molecular chaperone
MGCPTYSTCPLCAGIGVRPYAPHVSCCDVDPPDDGTCPRCHGEGFVEDAPTAKAPPRTVADVIGADDFPF